MMIPCKTLALILLLQAASADEPVAAAGTAPKPAASAVVKPTSAVAPNKPEPRQITPNAAAGLNTGSAVGSSAINSVYPYNMYANSLYSSGLKPSASSSGSSGGFLSLLRPGSSGSGSGRRSSLTSRIRSLVSSIFRRGEQPSYLGSASNYNYALRQPPVGFNGAAPPNSGLFGSPQGGSNQNLFGSSSNYQPITYPLNTGSQNSGLWSNYKQWASPSASSNSAPGSLGAANTANYAWSPPNQGSGSSFQGSGSPSFQGSSASSGPYQAAASNSYPAYNGYNQRSGTAFKPVAAAGSSNSAGDSNEGGFQGIKPNNII